MADGDTEPQGPSLELPKLGRRRARRPAPIESPVEVPVETPVAPPAAPVETKVEPKRERRPLRVPRPGGMLAAALTGAVVGLGIVGLTWAALRGCEAVQGTSSCGDVGYLLLGAILVIMVVVGALLLRVTQVPEPGSTSFLAVGLTSVIALLFLVDSLMDDAMIVVLPLICAGAFAASHWVTRTFIEAPHD